MTSASWSLSFIAAVSILIACPRPSHSWDSDIELYDLVEEIQKNFYEFLSVEQDASSTDIRKAYRRLSLTLHPDKNKDANAETQFRQLVGIYEVLKDEERRQRYNDVLVNGLPDWRQPVFYYRRVRKMSNGELGFLLFLILTVCHYVVIWSVYLEKQLDELLSKKKKEKKKKTSSKSAEESRFIGQEKIDRSHDKPHWQDILPLKLSTWLYLSVKSLPHVIQDAKQYYKDYKEMKIREKEEVEAMALAEQDATTIKEKRSKVKKPKFEFPVYEPSLTGADSANSLAYDQGTSIEEIENQLDDWLEDKKSQKKRWAPEWSEEDITLLTRSMAKFPGGTPGRWEKIAHELGRSVTDVTAKVKQVKDGQTNTSGLVKLSELKAQGSSAFPGKGSIAGAGAVPDSLMTQREDPQPPAAAMTEGTEYRGGGDEEEGIQSGGVRRRGKKTGGGRAGVEAKGHRQRDFDYTAAAEKDSGEEQSPPPSSVPQPSKEKATAETDDVWTQNQQKLLELALQQYPRGTTERWDWIAKVVPGKRKEECMIRYKLLAELVLKRKQAKS